jgi:hypothetical protein
VDYVFPSLEAFFSPQRSWVLPYRAFASPLVVGSMFPSISFALALFHITSSATYRRSSDFIPPKEPNPLLLSGGLVQIGTACSLGPLVSQVPRWTAQRSSPSLSSPHALILSPPCDRKIHEPQGISNHLGWLSPYGVPTCLTFLTDSHHSLFEKVTRRGLFFHLGG